MGLTLTLIVVANGKTERDSELFFALFQHDLLIRHHYYIKCACLLSQLRLSLVTDAVQAAIVDMRSKTFSSEEPPNAYIWNNFLAMHLISILMRASGIISSGLS